MTEKDKLLIVDDDFENIEIIREILGSSYTLQYAGNGSEAVEKLKNFKAELILLDWNMPVLDGLATLKLIKAAPETTHIQVIMMTGYMTSQADLLTAYHEGVIDFIRKPFDELELSARVKSIVQLGKFFKGEIDNKNRELVSLAIRLAENAESVNKVLRILDQMQQENSLTILNQQIIAIKEVLSVNIFEKSWTDFNMHFVSVHPNFNNKLIKVHPDLTPAELKLAVLMRLNLSSKEISAIIHSTIDSVRVSRTRLRKKLNLDSEDNLTGYLMQF